MPKPKAETGPVIAMPSIRPKKKLKALHWEKVDVPQVTLWAAHAPTVEEKDAKYQELSRKGILDEVEKLFMAKEIKILGASKAKNNEKKQIISRDLMHNFGISMAKFSQQSAEEVVRKIIHCAPEVLESTVVMEFLQKDDLCIIPDSTAKLMAPYSRDWTGPDAMNSQREQDPAELTREDQIYLWTAYELRHYWKSRMRALALTKSYEHEYDEISKSLKEVVNVAESLRDSTSLLNVLGLILSLGNYMNDANKQAIGFKLSTLARLGMMKDQKNESTFADMIERAVRQQYPEWEGFADEISGVLTAQKLNVEALKGEAKRYIENIKNVQASLDAGNLSDPKKFHPEDRVAIVVTRSMREARRKADQLQLYLEEMNSTFDEIMTFYGEDAGDENARRDFFPKLASFLLEWRKSKEKNLAMEENRRRNEASIARKRAANQTNPAAAGTGNDTKSADRDGAVDSLLEKLRAAAPQTRDTRDRRRRARLKDRHQNRIASGQEMPELANLAKERGSGDDSEGLLSPESVAEATEDAKEPLESEDVADRAASILQGLRKGDEGAEGGDGTLRIRRRRDPAMAEEERRARRRKRAAAEKGSELVEGSPVKGERTFEGAEEENREMDLNTSITADQPGSDEMSMSPDQAQGHGTEQAPIEVSD